MASAPKAVRLNHAEFAALAETEPAGLAAYARLHKTALGLSGKTDMVTDGERFATIANGHPLMAKVTAMGCAVSALAAACLAVEPDAFRATVAALVIAGVAGEVAAQQAQGPGSFAVAMTDALHNLDGQAVAGRAKVELAKVAE
jgi:hydroxyethylthiazole kinase